jgi:phage shock protein PspC (stress-responsive transcriptional regulator)
VRSRTHRIIAGVAGGAGQYLGIDPVVVRILFVVLTFAGGFGVLLYLAAWLIVPAAVPGTEVDPADVRDRRHTGLAIGAVVLLVLLGGFGRVGFGFGFDGRVVWPLTLVAIGAVVLWMRSERAPVLTAPPTAPSATATDVRPSSAPTTDELDQPSAAPGATPPPVPGRSLLRRLVPALGRLVLVVLAGLAGLVVALAAVAVLEGAGVLDITPIEAAVASLAVLAGAVWLVRRSHRVPELVVVGLAVTLVLGVAGWLEPPLRGGYGTRDIRPERAAALHDEYRLAAGRLRLDLSRVTLPDRVTTVTTELGAGLLQVVVPLGATVELDAHSGAGQVCAFGRHDDGLGVSRSSTATRGAPRLHLVSRVGAGVIELARTRHGLQDACHEPADGTRPGATTPSEPGVPGL